MPSRTASSFDCIYSISVLEHLPLETVAATCAAVGPRLAEDGYTVHAIDHVQLGPGDADHRVRLGLAVGRPRDRAGELDETLARLEADPETYFLSAESHNRWRGSTPYDEFPMRRCVSIQLCVPASEAAMSRRLDVGIVAYRCRDLLEACLDSLERASRPRGRCG